MSAAFYVKLMCHGCQKWSEHVVKAEEYSVKCPTCVQWLSVNHQAASLVPDKCGVCGRVFDDHRWVGNVAQCVGVRP